MHANKLELTDLAIIRASLSEAPQGWCENRISVCARMHTLSLIFSLSLQATT